MRKNNGYSERIKGLYVTYKIVGLNLDRFINRVKNSGIALFDIKKTSQKCLFVTVSAKDSQNFFAIAQELCYNIKKVRYKGKGVLIYKLGKSIGAVIGVLIFTVLSIYIDGMLLGINFSGTGALYKEQVREYLYDNGIKVGARFSDFDLSRLEDGILASNERLSFVCCEKRGTRLKIQLILAKDSVKTLDGNHYQLVSTCDGVIESIKVYRGTAQYNVGDKVSLGDVIVDGYVVIKEQTVKINVLACVSILTQKTYTYQSIRDGEEDIAVAFAMEELVCPTLSNKVEKIQTERGYTYTVTLGYRQVIYVG